MSLTTLAFLQLLDNQRPSARCRCGQSIEFAARRCRYCERRWLNRFAGQSAYPLAALIEGEPEVVQRDNPVYRDEGLRARLSEAQRGRKLTAQRLESARAGARKARECCSKPQERARHEVTFGDLPLGTRFYSVRGKCAGEIRIKIQQEKFQSVQGGPVYRMRAEARVIPVDVGGRP